MGHVKAKCVVEGFDGTIGGGKLLWLRRARLIGFSMRIRFWCQKLILSHVKRVAIVAESANF